MLFDLKKEKYTNLIKKCPPVSFFKKDNDSSKAEIIKNLYLGEVLYWKNLMLKDFNSFNLSYRDFKKKHSDLLTPEKFSKYKNRTYESI